MQTDLAKLVAIAEQRDALWAAGYRVLAVLSHDHSDRDRAGKAPLGPNWEKRARLDPPEVTRFPAVAHAANTGVLADGLRCVDIDIDDEKLAQRLRQLAQEMLGDTIIRRRANSGRSAMPYRAADGAPKKRTISGTLGKIEILGHGQQFVAHGRHPTGAELFWQPVPPEQMPFANLPAVTEEQISAFLDAAASLIGATSKANGLNGADGEHVAGEPQADLDRIAEAMRQITNDQTADWEWWNRLGLALWAATGGNEEGHQFWHEFSARHPAYDAKATEARWQHYAKEPLNKGGLDCI
jgi:Bifunctional DNA primase/polymerase, N-terminal/Primase C terminal 2 (PriCT-2)